ncbi:MAG: ATP synthase F1 subunit gamma [Lachnospiraceae bacterium]|nr:ATP synthase F1 subunit gamma [Lachnospiraceae bacterium]
MSNMKEIKGHIQSVKDTQKITNAMYLISSNKMRKIKKELDKTKPYFEEVALSIRRIFKTVKNVESDYFYPAGDSYTIEGTYGYLVITADKGLAGAYNQNVIKEATKLMTKKHDKLLFVVGEYGRRYFNSKNIPIEKTFLYTAQNPTLSRARQISNLLLDLYDNKKLSKIYIVFTDYESGMEAKVKVMRLLPFNRSDFNLSKAEKESEKNSTRNFVWPTGEIEFYPNAREALDNMISSYVTGIIYGALVDSFCSEQNARMNAMDSANRNAEELIDKLTIEYNHTRQAAITQEITEISAGARAKKKKRDKAVNRSRS